MSRKLNVHHFPLTSLCNQGTGCKGARYYSAAPPAPAACLTLQLEGRGLPPVRGQAATHAVHPQPL